MKTKLKEITDSTVNELLVNDIILPSSYFQCFDKHAKIKEVNINGDDFEEDLSNLIINEFEEINTYVNSAIKKMDKASDITADAQKAIQENNSQVLKELYSQISNLKEELEVITDNIYKDHLTKVNNKKWLYHKFLDDNSRIKKESIIVYIDVSDYDYISSTYNTLISDNLLIFITNYLNKYLKEEKLDFDLVRLSDSKFLIILDKKEMPLIITSLSNITKILFEKTLKSTSGIMIKPTFEYSLAAVNKDENFHEVLATLIKGIESKKEN